MYETDQKKWRRGAFRAAISVLAICAIPATVDANGLGESRPWQFRTSADRANLAGVADVVEKKKGGYYDGFTTVVNQTSTTNIGTQVNCNNVANATGNIADNAQGGNAPQTSVSGDIAADGSGNTATDQSNGDTGTDAGSTNSQTNDGSVTASVSGSDLTARSGTIQNGGTDNLLNNTQDNSGSQTATISGSEACNMAGSTLSGSVQSSEDGQIVTAGPLN